MRRRLQSWQPLLPVPLAAAAAGAGGINDDNREGVVKGEVGDPSKTQVIECRRQIWLMHPSMYVLSRCWTVFIHSVCPSSAFEAFIGFLFGLIKDAVIWQVCNHPDSSGTNQL